MNSKPEKVPNGASSSVLKRLSDILIASIFILVLAIPMLLVAIAVRVFLGSPILFVQERGGLNGEVFWLYKFRTMRNAKDKNDEPLPDSERLSKFGKLLRTTSFDELPELINILKGDMSFIGPRPLLTEYLPRYSTFQMRRHEVRPGLTGWAQINGRNALSWEDRFKLDVWYVDNWSLWLDLKILFLTVLKVLQAEGVSADAHVTMPKFMGEQQPLRANDVK